MTVTQILEDPREILYVAYVQSDTDGDFPQWITKEGRHKNCERIVAYGEPGHMIMLPWFAIYDGGEIIARLPASAVEVGYVRNTETPSTGE